MFCVCCGRLDGSGDLEDYHPHQVGLNFGHEMAVSESPSQANVQRQRLTFKHRSNPSNAKTPSFDAKLTMFQTTLAL